MAGPGGKTHFCGLLKYHQVWTARVMRHGAAPKSMDPLRGILPDMEVLPIREDLVRSRDTVLDHALSLSAGH